MTVPADGRVKTKIPSINTVKSTTAVASQRRIFNQDQSQSVGIIPNKPVTTSLMSPALDNITNTNNDNKLLITEQHQQQIADPSHIDVSFPSLSLAISPTISHDRMVEKVKTTTDSADITSSKNISTIQEQDSNDSVDIDKNTESKNVPNVTSLSLLSPDLNDVIPQKPASSQHIEMPFQSSFSNENLQNEDKTISKITNPVNAFQQFEDYVIYDGTKLFDENIELFLNEKEKLEDKLNDAMASYQSNNTQYLNNIVEQYRTQKLKQCQDINDQQAQTQFLKKLQHDLEILDESLKSQFEESQKTLYNQLTAIHHKRLKEFAMKLNQKNENENKNPQTQNPEIP